MRIDVARLLPIEKAPRDGRWIMGYFPRFECGGTAGMWVVPRVVIEERMVPIRWVPVEGNVEAGDWRIHKDRPAVIQPTHYWPIFYPTIEE